MDPERAWTWAVLSLLAAALVIQTARLVGRDLSMRRRLRERRQRARAGERDALPLLARAGYRVRGTQVRARLTYMLDGEPCHVDVQVDYLVERGGRAWIAEVKTGAEAPQLTTRATRRQLLEYAHAFDAHGVLLVDPERGRVHRVTLPERTRATPARDLALLLAGALVGAACALALAR